MTDISRELLHAQAQAEVDRLREQVADRATLKLEFNELESSFLARICGVAALDMIQDEADAENDDERKNVFMARIILSEIAHKFKDASAAAKLVNEANDHH